MSENWTVYCEDCEKYGPDIRRAAEGAPHLSNYWPRYHHHQELPKVTPQVAWRAWMAQHGWHQQRLVHE